MADNKQPTRPEEHITPEAAAPNMLGLVPGPDLTAEEAVTLEQEGRAALHEMGESLPDPGDIPEPTTEEPAAEAKKPLANLEAEKSKPQRGRSPKVEKSGPSASEPEKSLEAAKPRKSRQSMVDKAAPDGATPPKQDKMSQSKNTARKPEPAKETAPAPEPEQPPVPRDATRSEEPEQVVYLNLSELHAFKNHPFGLRDDAEMRSLVESVKAGGVNQPALVRPRAEGGYEIIAGHRRQKASELAGYANMPCIVRNMTDDEAVLAMTDDNLRQRTEILPTEKAQSLKMQVEAIKHQGAPAMGEVDQKDAGKRSTEVVGERNNMNYKQVQRYIRLTELAPDLQKMVNEKNLSFTPAVEISFIKPKNQSLIAVSIEGQQSAPSLAQAQKLRELDKEGKLNGDVIDGILSQEKKEVDKVIISTAELANYFGKEKTPREMKDQIIALLDDWKAKQPPELAKPEKKADLEK